MIVGVVILTVIVGYQLFNSITGRNQQKQYSVIEINDSFDQSLLNFLDGKKNEIRKDSESP